MGSLLQKFSGLSLQHQAYWVAGVSFALDQLSKIAIIFTLPFRHKITLTPFMDFIYILNRGVSYGLLSGLGPWGRWFLVVVALGLIAVCWHWLKTAPSPMHALSLGLIIGGGFGNVLDRLLYGGVVDFISLHAFGFYWYVFNVADMWLTCGIIMFFLAEFRTGAKNSA